MPSIVHWSQVKEIRKKSRGKPNRVKLRENKQLNDLIFLGARVRDLTETTPRTAHAGELGSPVVSSKKIYFNSCLKKGASIKVEKIFTDSYSLRGLAARVRSNV